MAYQSNYTGSQIDAGISKTTKMTADGDNITFAGKVTVSAPPTGDMDVVNKGYLSNVSGITAEIKQALLQCFQKVAWIDDQGQDYYDALYDALYPPVGLDSITCVYTQSGTVYDTDSLDDLKSDLVVTAHYDDSSTQIITTYTLSGTLAEGTSTITVLYGGQTTTFTVTVTHNNMQILHNWDFTQSLNDSVGGVTATLLSGLTRDNNGVNFNGNSQCIDLGAVYDRDLCIDVEMSNVDIQAPPSSYYHTRTIMYGNSASTGTGLLIFRAGGTTGWASYVGGTWSNRFGNLTSRDDFDTIGDKKITIKIESSGAYSLYVDDVLIGTSNLTAPEKSETITNLYIGNTAGYSNGGTFHDATVKRVKIYKEL